MPSERRLLVSCARGGLTECVGERGGAAGPLDGAWEGGLSPTSPPSWPLYPSRLSVFLVFRLEIPSPEVKSSSSGELHLESEKRPPSGEVPGRLGPEPKAGDCRTGHPAVQGRDPAQTMSLPRV